MTIQAIELLEPSDVVPGCLGAGSIPELLLRWVSSIPIRLVGTGVSAAGTAYGCLYRRGSAVAVTFVLNQGS